MPSIVVDPLRITWYLGLRLKASGPTNPRIRSRDAADAEDRYHPRGVPDSHSSLDMEVVVKKGVHHAPGKTSWDARK